MKKGDFLWGLALLIWIVVLVVPGTRAAFISASDAHPYIGGFIKFAILATMGDLLGARVLKGKWIIPKGLFYRVIIWGIIGLWLHWYLRYTWEVLQLPRHREGFRLKVQI